MMGLLNWNDIEIEIKLFPQDNEPKTAKVKLRDSKDAEACQRLIEKLSVLVATPKQDNPQ
ncbi:hypothetical protein [Candidatus Sodalis sp. SoCistrobi]|uniref:hypothetical protein n=1 Tax=Candidatus Sodalis sp. SoCistrobi TaxID=1922216 RepID=UPI00093C83E9|nr:hypothetical protein [Candidatus Sodalis sp. SoCistrobi]